MIVPPFYSSPTEDELFVHYKRIAEAISLPIMIYNNPFTSNVDMKAPLVARLSRIPNISYIKEFSGSVPRVSEIIRLCGEAMTVFAGYFPWESYLAGAAGYVSVFSNIAPDLSTALFVKTVEERDVEAGRRINDRIAALLDAISGDGRLRHQGGVGDARHVGGRSAPAPPASADAQDRAAASCAGRVRDCLPPD